MSAVRPEETVATETVYSSGFLNLKEVEVKLPNGKNSKRIIVEHPQAVAVLPVLSDGRLVLIRQYRKAAERTLLEVPAGLIDQGEEPEQTVRREMKEETGYDIGSVEHLISFYTSPGFTNELMHLYLAKDLQSGTPTEEIDEIEVVVMSLNDALERVAAGEIADAKSNSRLALVRTEPDGRLTQPQLRAAVTGASRGIGRATVLELARHGFLVFGLARSREALDELASAAGQEGLHVTPVVMDIADAESRQQAIEAITSATEGYGVDVLVNNAGYGHFGPLEEVSEEELLRQFQVNVFGLHAVTRAFLPGMRERQRGWIVNVSSVSGRLAMPFNGPYAATKFALEAMSDAMRLELHPFGVHVILIEPGPIPTDFWRSAKGGELNATSPYARFTGRWRGTSGVVTGLLDRSPETVARVIRRAVQSDHPRTRYTITVHAKVGSAARRLVPDFLMDMVIRLAMGLRRQ